MIHLQTYSGHAYTLDANGTITPQPRMIGVTHHKWSRTVQDSLSDVHELPELLSGAWLWTSTGRWDDRIRVAWQE